MTTRHPAEDERSRFDELAERASNFTSSPAFFALCVAMVVAWLATIAVGQLEHPIAADAMAALALLLVAMLKNAERRSEAAIQQKLDAIAAALLEQRRGNETAAQDELAAAIRLHDEI